MTATIKTSVKAALLALFALRGGAGPETQADAADAIAAAVADAIGPRLSAAEGAVSSLDGRVTTLEGGGGT